MPPTLPTVALSPSDHTLIGAKLAAEKAGCSMRHWQRMCDRGEAPPGIKIGVLRRWDVAVLNAWIAGGCQPVVQPVSEGEGH